MGIIEADHNDIGALSPFGGVKGGKDDLVLDHPCVQFVFVVAVWNVAWNVVCDQQVFQHASDVVFGTYGLSQNEDVIVFCAVSKHTEQHVFENIECGIVTTVQWTSHVDHLFPWFARHDAFFVQHDAVEKFPHRIRDAVRCMEGVLDKIGGQ